MITLSVLTVISLLIAVIAAAITLACGAGFILAFGDIIVAALIVVLIAKLFTKNNKKKENDKKDKES